MLENHLRQVKNRIRRAGLRKEIGRWFRPSVIRANLESVRRRVAAAAERAGRAPESVRLVAVTKTVGLDEIRALHDLGVRDFGESRVLEALRRIEALKGLGARWHMIGHVQTKKANKVIGAFDLIHSLDSVRLAQALEAAAASSQADRLRADRGQRQRRGDQGRLRAGRSRPALEEISRMKSPPRGRPDDHGADRPPIRSRRARSSRN